MFTTLIPIAILAHLATFQAASAHFQLDVANQAASSEAIHGPSTKKAAAAGKTIEPSAESTAPTLEDSFCVRSTVDDSAPAPVEVTIAIRETTFSEKYGLGLEESVHPDPELASLQNKFKQLESAVGSFAHSSKVSWETPALNGPDSAYWNKQLVLTWDDDGGYYLGTRYYPPVPANESRPFPSFFVGGIDR